MTAHRPLLTLDAVTLWRGTTPIVRDIQWRVARGENWAVLGANGAGKSRLAAAIAGDAHHSGEIQYGFRGYQRDPCERIASVSFGLHRKFVAQSDSYYQSRWYLGEEAETQSAGAILLAAAGAGESALRRARRVAARVGLDSHWDRQALHLSTGEMRRLLIARALLADPVLLLLDEPFIGLDANGRRTLSEILSDLMAHGHQLILFTARPWELPKGITHSLWLARGRVVGSGRHWRSFAETMERRVFRAPRNAPMPRVPRRRVSAATKVVEVHDIHLAIQGVPILQGIDWTVRGGERWALQGPNGAGKTTLLSFLLGDHPQAFAQHVKLFGRLRSEQTLWDWKGRIGWASPDVTLHYDTSTSTLDLVCTGFFDTLGLYSRCSRVQARLALRWLAYFGLEDAAAQPFRTLSDGQQRLALMARALVKRPRLLILDEPCQGLDRHARTRVLNALDTVCARAGTTLIIVTHYPDELPQVITHALKLRQGRVESVGSFEALKGNTPRG